MPWLTKIKCDTWQRQPQLIKKTCPRFVSLSETQAQAQYSSMNSKTQISRNISDPFVWHLYSTFGIEAGWQTEWFNI